jgi:hypothetical protein
MTRKASTKIDDESAKNGRNEKRWQFMPWGKGASRKTEPDPELPCVVGKTSKG